MNTTPVTRFDSLVQDVRASTVTADGAAEALIAEMTDTELLGLLDGDLGGRRMASLPKLIAAGPVVAGEIPRLGFPGVRFSDGPRGVVIGRSTSFPVTMARGATWDPELEQRVGLAMGREARAYGANYSGAVCINLVRHPSWGRAQESYGEDPVLLGRMGAGLTSGLRRNVMACVKHYALNSIEDARFKLDVSVDEHALHEVYLPHFKTVIDAGADSVMNAYNAVNGHFCGENKTLCTDVLRDEWGFTGFVTSDWVWGIHDGVASLEAGVDVEMPLHALRGARLAKAFANGVVSRQTVLKSARRIVATIIAHTAQRDLPEPSVDVIASPEHRALARLVAVRGAVLLQNERDGDTPVLPLPAGVKQLAVIGRLAAEANLGDVGSSKVNPPSTCSPLEGLREALPEAAIVFDDGQNVASAMLAASQAEVVVMVVGLDHTDEGEMMINPDIDLSLLGFPFTLQPVKSAVSKVVARQASRQFGVSGDRDSLTLRAHDEELIQAVAAANPRTVVVVIGGSAIIMEAWRRFVPAILLAWYPGMEGGRAIADVLTGAEEPGGRLPMAIPTDADHLPYFDKHASAITYDAWWGQRMLDRDTRSAAFPFGFGLGYTEFAVKLIASDLDAEPPTATVEVRNTGARWGSTVAQVYAIEEVEMVPQLIGFRRVELATGESAKCVIDLDLTPMISRDPASKEWTTRPGAWGVYAGQNSADARAQLP